MKTYVTKRYQVASDALGIAKPWLTGYPPIVVTINSLGRQYWQWLDGKVIDEQQIRLIRDRCPAYEVI